jgi:serine/threonine-protein kinase
MPDKSYIMNQQLIIKTDMKPIKFIGMVIILAVIVACGQNKQKKEQVETTVKWNTFEQQDFKVQYPDSFELNTSGDMGMTFILFSKLTSPQDKFRDNINLIIQDLTGLNMTLDQYVAISEEQVVTMITNGNIIESKRIKRNNSEFQKIICTGIQGQFDLKFMQYYIIKDEKAYVLTLTAEVDQFDNYKNVGEKIMDSFVVK